jgi:hypothetical protein
MKRRMETVKQMAFDNAPRQLLAKTTGFFDNMCCMSYMKEQVSAEAIELDYDGDENAIIQHAFTWMDIDEVGEDECKSDGDWSTIEDCPSDFEVFSRSPARKYKTFENDSPSTPPSYPLKSPDGSLCTATTATMNTVNTNESWETISQQSSTSSNPAVGGEFFSNSESSPPRTIAVPSSKIPSFKLKQRKGRMEYPRGMDFPSLPSENSMREMQRSESLGNITYTYRAARAA